MMCLTPSNKHKTLYRWYDDACESDRANPRKPVDNLLYKLCRTHIEKEVAKLSAPMHEAMDNIPSHIHGFANIVEKYLEEVVVKIILELWEREEAKVLTALEDRILDATYGGKWA